MFHRMKLSVLNIPQRIATLKLWFITDPNLLRWLRIFLENENNLKSESYVLYFYSNRYAIILNCSLTFRTWRQDSHHLASDQENKVLLELQLVHIVYRIKYLLVTGLFLSNISLHLLQIASFVLYRKYNNFFLRKSSINPTHCNEKFKIHWNILSEYINGIWWFWMEKLFSNSEFQWNHHLTITYLLN